MQGMKLSRFFLGNNSSEGLISVSEQLSKLFKGKNANELRKAVVIFCGDTAVDGVNQTQGKLSYKEAVVVSQGYAPINAVARHINAPVYIIDVGLQQDVQTVSGILSQKVIHGTHQGYPAMDKEVTGHAIAVGVSVL